MSEEIDLHFLARKMDQLFNEFGTVRDEVVGLSAMVQRLDATVDGLKEEIRRMRKLEATK